MESKEKLLMELLGHTARSLTHLTASMTSMSFERCAAKTMWSNLPAAT